MYRIQWGVAFLPCFVAFALGSATGAEQAKPIKPFKLTARVDGYTQAVMFNPQKFPLQYTGFVTLKDEHMAALAKAGEMPPPVCTRVLSCLLWKPDSVLEKAVLKSDGSKLVGEAHILHRYGEQGKHLLKIKLEGAMEQGRLSLQATEVTLSGSWDYGGGTIQLKGEAKIKIDCSK